MGLLPLVNHHPPHFASQHTHPAPAPPLPPQNKHPPPPIHFLQKHAPLLDGVFQRVWGIAGHDPKHPVLRHISKYSGGHVNRPVRGSSRKSTHAFAASMDFDAEALPMGKRFSKDFMPKELVNAFYEFGLFWGGDYLGRPDAM